MLEIVIRNVIVQNALGIGTSNIIDGKFSNHVKPDVGVINLCYAHVYVIYAHTVLSYFIYKFIT